MTAHVTAAWVERSLVEAPAWGRRPTYLIRNRGRVLAEDIRDRAEALGIDDAAVLRREPDAAATSHPRRRPGAANGPQRPRCMLAPTTQRRVRR